MSLVAHSIPDNHAGIQPHLYSDHVSETLEYGLSLVDHLLSFSHLSQKEKDQIKTTLTATIMLHDMGKLDEENQKILRGESKGRLPVDHIEAGVAVAASMQNELMGWLIRGHHAPGLPSRKEEKYFIQQLNRENNENYSLFSLRGCRHKRAAREDRDAYFKHYRVIQRTDGQLRDYEDRQRKNCGQWPSVPMALPPDGIIVRLLLSCLVSADHESTAAYSSNSPMPNFFLNEPAWEKRLQALDEYIESLPKDEANERYSMRQDFYQFCRKEELFSSKLAMCSAPVGSGKTTSVMAYLLRKSIKSNASRIIIVAPFSNIIDQTVATLRKAVVLKGEDPEEVVVAHHHKIEFSNEEMRQYSALWQAPVVVTTAVQFFETLAGSNPSKLRKLNSVAGASIFIDESHACLPSAFLKITWNWLKKLSEDWNCNIVFSSGSTVEFWNDTYLVGNLTQKLPDLFSEELKQKSQKYEQVRIEFKKIDNVLTLNDLIGFIQSEDIWQESIQSSKPSCLVILNTVQSCAVVAEALARSLTDFKNTAITQKTVLHLSTSLAPKDRTKILHEIERRQKKSEWDKTPWYLVATSCVEAGVDLDFSLGFRERCSVTSFLQVSGRVNRHGVRPGGVLYDFRIISEDGLTLHPGFKESAAVFDALWQDMVSPTISLTGLSTAAVRKEFSRYPKKKIASDNLMKEEEKLNFQQVSDAYRIIDSDTATVIVDRDLVEKLKRGIPVNWQTIQTNSVQLWISKIAKLRLNPIEKCFKDNIYSWVDSYEYDPEFLGIMGGILKTENFFKNEYGIL